ncbi:nucleotidyl transferase AbiEii/AbiGii toxin family protein [Candidatus Roizmanbacteria bacterium]|nr:nucleotidyl transferase AbiEii/AbiGii toxin family protein [Candidatus Roizmanbacteria bacterium]
MTLNIPTHKTILFQILKEIYSDTTIAPFLGFKGGTATLLFYNLDRFSVDLDFDLLDESKEDYIFERVSKIAEKYGILKESYIKRFNLFWLISYEEKAHNIKIEINRRQFGSHYELKTYMGVSMLVMVKEDMFAHKLMAMSERINKTSRDIYDVWFFLKNRFPINKEIIEKRSEIGFNDFLAKCVTQLEKLDNKNILLGIGELLTISQKDWVKSHLKAEAISLLKLRINTDTVSSS